MEADNLLLEPKIKVMKKMEEMIDKNTSSSILTIEGDEYHTTLSKKYLNRKKWVKPDEKLIFSFIPGTVDKLFVSDGQKVVKGEKLMVLEAMKMLNNFAAPITGIIKKVNVKEGDKVPKGTLMIEFA